MIKIPNYQIGTQIYESANSLVYRGVRKEDNQPVILKVLKEDYPTPAELTRYRQEYEITRDLDLDGVIKAYNIEKYQNTLVIVLEDFGGDSLKQLMVDRPLTVVEFLLRALQIADSLGQIHAANIIHKDINPANIVWHKESNQLKLIDFGIASRLPRENPVLKNPEQLEGTLAYISPEQTGRMNRSLDYRTDLYSLGVTFYELLTGKVPFESDSAMELVHCHIAKTPKPVSEINSDIPLIISDIIMKLMAKNVEDRYQSSFGVKADLEKCLENLTGLQDLSGLQFELAQNDFLGQLQIQQKLYGREHEINILLQAFERVSEGVAEMMLVAGYSGIGKSILIKEIYKSLSEKQGYFISGKFDEFQRNIPYSAVVDAFKELVQQLLTENEAQLLIWKEKLLTALGPNGQVIIDVLPEIQWIIGMQPKVPELGSTESQNRFNLVFQNFMRVFCQPEHPLVLFLDDLQWVDSATLKLLELILTLKDNSSLYLIGAYRDNEVEATHSLMMTLDKLREEGVIINQIILKPLAFEHINQLIAESLHHNLATVSSLTDLVREKTGGNPFFVNQFLHTLYQEDLLHFFSPKGKQKAHWQWDIAQIEAMNITDNVVDLMIGKLKKLPESARQVLRLAACIGNRFDLETLSVICEKSPAETFQDLRPILIEEFILPSSSLELGDEEIHASPLTIRYFHFLHDRVQQAAYALIDEKQKQVVHLQIGRLLLKNTPTEVLEDKIFDLVNQFNAGMSLLTHETEKIKLAELNLLASKKARNTMAYLAADRYVNVGIACLMANSWESHYHITFELYKIRAELEYLNGHFQSSETWINLMLEKAKSIFEKVDVYVLLIIQLTMQTKYIEATQTGLEALNLLGIKLPQENLEATFHDELANTEINLENRKIASLLNSPEISRHEKRLANQLLSNLQPLTFMTNRSLFHVVTLKAVNLSLKYGHTSESAHSYAWYSHILGSVLQDYQTSYEFGRLSLKIAEQFNNLTQKCKAFDVFSNFASVWVQDLKQTNYLNNIAYEAALASGELAFAGYNLVHQLFNGFSQGMPLLELLLKSRSFIRFTEKIGHQYASDALQGIQLVILNLKGMTSEKTSFHNEQMNEVEYLARYSNKNFYALCRYQVLKSQVLYLYDHFYEALQCALEAEKLSDFILGTISVAEQNFYHSLCLAALTGSESKQPQYWKKLQINQKQMKIWAKHAPINFQHKYDLVEAEKARILGQINAIEWYEKAIAGAKENKYLHEEALAYELAAKFYLRRGMEKIAQTYLREAHYAYQQWGALAKMRDLENKYPQLLTRRDSKIPETTFQSATIMVSASTQLQPSTQLDLESITKAAQTLSGEIVLDRLLSKMMHIVIENAGAERGFLILPVDEKWVIEAEGALDKEEVTILHSLPVESHLPEAIISYVARTQENVVLMDATQEGLYTENPYIKTHQTQSVLCFPIVYQQQLRAILYFENNLTTGAFTETRLNMLKMLSSQIAISLENAQVMAHLDTKVKERTAQLNTKIDELTQTRQELVQSEKMASLGRLVAGFAHELNTPLGVALGTASVLFDNAVAVNLLLEQEEVDEQELIDRLDDVKEVAGMTVSNLERAANLVTSFKRTAVDQSSDQVRVFLVLEVINDTMSTLHSRFKNTAIEISVNCPNDFKVNSLPGALEQILTNLLMNSLIHGFNEGQNTGTINIKAQRDGGNLHVEYSDNGKGIAAENLEKIFEPFFTTHRAHGGSGLGMYICYNLITTQLQGTITCESQLGEGVLFKIDYPI
jgi:predicted ATPase/signal transduction histidine kinase